MRAKIVRFAAWIAVVLLALGTTSCFSVPRITVLSSHTVQAAADKEEDVIWILHGTVLKRCVPTSSGPTCTAASGAEGRR